MLVLSRKLNERIRIGDDIIITVCRVDYRGQVRLGIEAPGNVVVLREELYETNERDKRERGQQ